MSELTKKWDRITAHVRILLTDLEPKHRPKLLRELATELDYDLGLVVPKCPYCNNAAEKATGHDLYPERKDLHDKEFWRCRPCDAHVGCHPRTSTPLGSLADAKLREARQRTHEVFDALWKGDKPLFASRKAAYAWLAGLMWMDKEMCHIARFDVDACAAAIRHCEQMTKAVRP